MEVVCTLTREQAALYQAVVDDWRARGLARPWPTPTRLPAGPS